MRTTLITLLLSITLFSCQEYSDEDYLALEANHERTLQRDKEYIQGLQAALSESESNAQQLQRDLVDLEYASEAELLELQMNIQNTIDYISEQYIIEIDRLSRYIANQPNHLLANDNMYRLLEQTYYELEALKIDYTNSLTINAELEAYILELQAIIEALGGYDTD